MARSRLRLDTRRALKDGTYPIQIIVGHGTNIYLSTGVYALREEWDERTQQYVGKGARRINAILVSMLASTINRIMDIKESGQWDKYSNRQLKQMLTDLELDRPTIEVPTVGSVFAEMNSNKSACMSGTAKSTAAKIREFGYDIDKLAFGDIDLKWIENFNASMSSIAVNTRALYMQTLKRAFSWAVDHEIIKDNPFAKFKIKKEVTRMRDLPIDKFRLLAKLDVHKIYEEYRDMFLLTFYLIGINSVDLADCTSDSIVNGRLEYRRHKTNKLYSIKLEPEALEIIERYKGKQHLLRCFDKHSNYQSYQIMINRALSKIGPAKLGKDGKPILTVNKRVVMEPIEPRMTMYWARYSWATYAADLDIPKDTISEALGHTYGAPVTGVYIKYNRDKVDAANRKVIDYLLGNSES